MTNPTGSMLCVLTIALFLTGLGLTIYQIVRLMTRFSQQPTISRVTPYYSSALERPDVIICKNIYFEVIARYYKLSKKEAQFNRLQFMATIGGDLGVFLRKNVIDVVNVSLSEHHMDEMATIVSDIAAEFMECGNVLGKCNTVMNGMAYARGYDCCLDAEQLTTFKEVCYRIPMKEPQTEAGKLYAAIYELRYHADMQSEGYHMYLRGRNMPFASLGLLPVVIGASTEVNVDVQKRVLVKGNFSETCTTIPEMANPVCIDTRQSNFTEMICKCKSSMPHNNNTKSHFGIPTCRPLEMAMCFNTKSFEKVYYPQYRQYLSGCYKTMCTDTKFDTQISASKLLKGSEKYLNSADHDDDKFSILYVFFGSMTILYETETKAQDWLGAVSSLGGVCGLWLGWSVYDIGKRFLELSINLGYSIRSYYHARSKKPHRLECTIEKV